MRHIILTLVLLSCGAQPQPVPRPPTPPPLPHGEVSCVAYCERLQQCAPEVYYDACVPDCEGLRVDLEAQRVSGLTDELLACWGASRSCEQARACDGVAW